MKISPNQVTRDVQHKSVRRKKDAWKEGKMKMWFGNHMKARGVALLGTITSAGLRTPAAVVSGVFMIPAGLIIAGIGIVTTTVPMTDTGSGMLIAGVIIPLNALLQTVFRPLDMIHPQIGGALKIRAVQSRLFTQLTKSKGSDGPMKSTYGRKFAKFVVIH